MNNSTATATSTASTSRSLMDTAMAKWYHKGVQHGHQSSQAAGFWGATPGSQMSHPDAWHYPPARVAAEAIAAGDVIRIKYTDARLNLPARSGDDPHAAYAANLGVPW